MLVPLNPAHVPCDRGTAERIPTPGALTSGFISSEYGDGPPDEKEAIVSVAFNPPPPFVAATAIARAALAGESIEPRPKSSKSLPAATTGTTPARAAPLSARTTRSRVGEISGSPKEQLSTSIPSLTAASTAFAISV